MADTVRIPVPAPLDHQKAAYDSEARFKLLPCGRRWGKDRVGFTSAMVGHGPVTKGMPLHEGVAQGWWVGWVVRDFTQGRGIWLEEFEPRFRPLAPDIQTNKSEMRITFPNGGGVMLCTAENIDSLRGLGKSLKGVVVNEAAHFDLAHAWKSVINWLLVDNMGWAYFMSTTNCRGDGNAEGLTPSYFNRLCQEVKQGARSDAWALFPGTIFDNPLLPKEAVKEALADLEVDSIEYQEEALAAFLDAGTGLAFPSWNPAVHLIHEFTPAPYWRYVCGMDWGIRSPACIELLAFGPDERVIALEEWTWTDKDAYEAGFDFATELISRELPGWPQMVWCDEAMHERTAQGGMTILGEFQRGVDAGIVKTGMHLPCVAAPKMGQGEYGFRAACFNLTTKLLSWGPALADGSIPLTRRPRFVMARKDGKPACPMLAKDFATMPVHPKRKMDVDETRVGAHAWAAFRYATISENPKIKKPVEDVPADQHPGFLPNGQRRSRERTPEVERKEREIIWTAKRQKQGASGRYVRPSR